MRNLSILAALTSSFNVRSRWNKFYKRTSFWDKHTRNKNKLNLSSLEREHLSELNGKEKKNYLKSLRHSKRL